MVSAPAKKKTSVIAAAVAAAAATGASSLSVPSAMVRRGSAPDMIQTELASINEQISGTAMLVCVWGELIGIEKSRGPVPNTGLGKRVVPRLWELATCGQRESGGGIHAT